MSTEIMIPFQLDHGGRIAKVDDPDSRIRLHVMSLINTQPGERTALSNYGVPLNTILFETHDLAQQSVYTDIEEAASFWEPGVTFEASLENPEQDSEVLMSLSYSRNDSPAIDTGLPPTHTNTVTIGPGGVINQIERG